MPSISDLFGINAAALNAAPQRIRNIPPAPKPEYSQMIEDLKRQFGQ